MTNFYIDILIAFISGVIVFSLIEYLAYKYTKNPEGFPYTKDITTNVITFTKDYQELLISRLGNDTGYDILYGRTYHYTFNSSLNYIRY
jgi:hypothetical protein